MSDIKFSSQMGLASKSPKEEQVHNSYMCEYELWGVRSTACVSIRMPMLSTPV
jgi:hypothetical protein